MGSGTENQRRRWRFYRTATGRRPVHEFLASLPDAEAADIAAAMKEVARVGLSAGRHVEGDIYEVRAISDRQSFRILFAAEGRRGQVLLALDGYSKKQRRLPQRHLELARRRLGEWRSRARK